MACDGGEMNDCPINRGVRDCALSGMRHRGIALTSAGESVTL